MPYVPVPLKDLGLGGIIADIPTYDLELNQQSGGLNVVYRNGAISKANGYEVIAKIPNSLVGGAVYPTWTQSWFDDQRVIRNAIACSTKILMWDGTSLTLASVVDQSNAALTLTSSLVWQSALLSDYCILNNGINKPMYSWNAGTNRKDGSVFREIPGWGAANSPGGAARSVRAFKSFLFALGVQSEPYSVFTSDEAPPAGFPLKWDYVDLTSLATRTPLATADGVLIDAVPLGDGMIVYTERAAYAFWLSGGNSIFSNRRIFPWGVLNTDCAVQFENLHFVVGNEVIYVHDGNTPRRVAERKVERRLYSECSDLTKIRVVVVPQQNEIRIYYPTAGNATPNRMLVWNWLLNTWSFEEAPNVPGCDLTFEATALKRFSDYPTTKFSAMTQRFSDFQSADSRRKFIGVTAQGGPLDKTIGGTQYRGGLLRFDRNSTRDNGDGTANDYYAYIERRGLDLDELFKTTNRQHKLRRAILQIRGTGNVKVQFGVAKGVRDTVKWGPTKTFSLDDDTVFKVDYRATGRYLSYRIGSWNDGTAPLPGTWTLTGIELDATDGGI